MPREFEIDAYRNDRELLIILRGRLVLPQCQEAKTRLQSLFTAQSDQVYMHLPGLTFLDSAGLGVLVGLKMLSNRNRTRLVFLSPPPRIEDIFRVSKLDTIFDIRSGVESDAICASLQRDEFMVWRDSKDARQAMFNTQMNEGPDAASGLTQMNAEPNSGETGLQVRKLCLDAIEYMRQGDLDRAVEAYKRALKIEPENLSALNNLGVIYEKKADWYSFARETWERVLELSQRHGDEKHAERARKHLDSIAKLMG